jgi:hypothetical protein
MDPKPNEHVGSGPRLIPDEMIEQQSLSAVLIHPTDVPIARSAAIDVPP